jgi:ABC-2 type transport system ATP-binding protein
MDRFSTHKVIELQFADSVVPADLERYGTVFDVKLPRAKLKVPRGQVPEVLSSLLSRFAVEDVSVHERPLEEVIAELFQDK